MRTPKVILSRFSADLVARVAREEIREELHTRMMPSMLSFLNDEITTANDLSDGCSDPMNQAQLTRLCADLLAIRQALEAVLLTSIALLRDR